MYLSFLFSSMINHGYAPAIFLQSNMVSIPKGARANVTDSNMYLSIAISSIKSKILDNVIIEQQQLSLATSSYQFGFKSKAAIVHNLSNDVAFQLDKRIVCFIHNALNHSNKVCRLLLLAKLHSISSTFATNYRHLCYKYELVQSDWHSGLTHLLGKVKMKYQNKNSQNCPANMSIIRELCDIRDGRHIACDIISKTEVCSLLDIICTE